MNETLQHLLREATRLTRTGRLGEATAAIQRALRGSAAAAAPHADAAPMISNVPAPTEILDGCVFEVDARAAGSEPTDAPQPFTAPEFAAPEAARAAAPNDPASFTSGTHTHAGLSRDYKLYAPPGAAGKSLPLVVMLHGCTQDPDDFAAGTGMNDLAAEQSFFVLYPAQAQGANPQRCWNWFKSNHQRRGSGEPALLASLAQAVIAQHNIDSRRVYIAGLSAGGAMAAIVAAAYPEVFAAAGVHSGLPAGAAGNVAEALAVMASGAAGAGLGSGPGSGLGRRPGWAGAVPASASASASASVPTIVFHGDQDRTVHPRNGDQVIAAAISAAVGSAAASPALEQGASARGKRFTRAVHRAEDGSVRAEHWLLHGAGHAWSGGRASGSYTAPDGPDATREMLRFFLAHPQPEPQPQPHSQSPRA